MLGWVCNYRVIFFVELGKAGVVRLVRRTGIFNRESFGFFRVPNDSFTPVANAANAT